MPHRAYRAPRRARALAASLLTLASSYAVATAAAAQGTTSAATGHPSHDASSHAATTHAGAAAHGMAHAASGGADSRSATSADEAGVRAAIEHYLLGHATGDPEHYRKAFHPEAELFFVRDGKLTQWSLDEYIARAGTGKPAADEARRRRRIASVDVTGTAATAKVELDYPEVRFVDYMALLKLNGEWRIVNKTFDAERRARP